MRTKLIFILLICYASLSFGQIHEIGVFFGGTNFIGDIGKTNYILPNAFGGGLVYKYNLNPRIALRGNYNYLSLNADDGRADNPYRELRGNKFTNNVHEFAIGSEYNFFEYNINDRKTAYTPYILTQFALISYNAPRSYNNGDLITKATSSYAIPVGLGFKGRLADNLAFAIESGVRFTFKNDLDYTTEDIPELNFGGLGNDHYLFTGFSIVYTFGRAACFADLE